MHRVRERGLMQGIKIDQGSNLTFTFMAKFNLTLRDEKGKAHECMSWFS